MVENNENNVQINKVEKQKIYGLNIAALVLGIISLVLWCVWCISIPCSILSLIFGIIGIKKEGKSMAIGGIVTGAISLALWFLVFTGAFLFGFMQGITEESYSYNTSMYWEDSI